MPDTFLTRIVLVDKKGKPYVPAEDAVMNVKLIRAKAVRIEKDPRRRTGPPVPGRPVVELGTPGIELTLEVQ